MGQSAPDGLLNTCGVHHHGRHHQQQDQEEHQLIAASFSPHWMSSELQVCGLADILQTVAKPPEGGKHTACADSSLRVDFDDYDVIIIKL
jgi:hypothetical protein